MNPKLILCLALLLSGGLFGCSTTARHDASSRQADAPLYVYFGSEDHGSANRFLSARIRLGENMVVGGDDYWELRGNIHRQGTNLVADLLGGTGQEEQFYRGNITLEKPFFGQGGAASDGAGLCWFIVSTNSDCRTTLEHVNSVMGFTNAPFNHPAEIWFPSALTNVSNQSAPNTGVPPENMLMDPTTGLPLKHNK